jgi:hypothetical protein
MGEICADKNCNYSHDGRACDGCGKLFCDDCYENLESDYEIDYSDPEYPEGTMLDIPKKYCDECCE